MIDISRRIGKFKLDTELMEDYLKEFYPENPVFRSVVPMMVESNFLEGTVTITGCSKEFRELENGEEIPMYQVNMMSLSGQVNGEVVVFFKEMEHLSIPNQTPTESSIREMLSWFLFDPANDDTLEKIYFEAMERFPDKDLDFAYREIDGLTRIVVDLDGEELLIYPQHDGT